MAKKETGSKNKANQSKAAAKPEKKSGVKKLSVKKLEERIAPSMVGGGIVDPGMVDSPEPQDAPRDPNAGQVSSTSVENTSSYSSQESGGSYQNQQANTGSIGSDSDTSGDSKHETDADSDYANLDQAGGQNAGYVEETPAWQEADWVTANADGSAHIALPEGVSAEGGIASFPVDVANEQLPLPEGVSIQTDGAMKVELPESASYNEATGTVNLPADSTLAQAVPESFESYPNPDGTLAVALPENGVTFDAQANTLTFDNSAVNEALPSNIEVDENGAVTVQLPEGTEVNANGTIDLSADQAAWMNNPPPEAVMDCEWADAHPDGSLTFEPPADVQIDTHEGVATLSPDAIQEHFPEQIPEDVQFNDDGTMDYKVPEGTQYDADARMLTVPGEPGELHTGDTPEAFNAHVNEDGSMSVTLPPGVEYNAEAGAVHFDNHWTNEMVQHEHPQVEFNDQGQFEVGLPPGTEFGNDGSFTIPPEHADFMNDPAPDYVMNGPNWVEASPDGSVQFQPPSDVHVDTQAGTMTMSVDVVEEHFNEQIPEDMTLNPDGTMDIKVPEGTQYDADSHMLTLPAGEIHDPSDIPADFQPHLNSDGSFSVTLPEGVNYDSASGSVHFDNEWTNEIVQTEHPNIEISPQGQVEVGLPPDTEFKADGSFTIPEGSADFIDNPAPAYVTEGPEWVGANPDGSVSFTPPSNVEVDPEAGTMTMPVAAVTEHFETQIPDEVKLNSDGTMDIRVSEDASYDSEARTLTLPAGEGPSPSEIPGAFQPQLEEGNLMITLPPGVEYNDANGSLHFDNHWTNEIAQVEHPNVEISPQGEVAVTLPPQTQYFDNGGFVVPAEHADFIDNPAPEYVNSGPEWVALETDGSVSFTPPENVEVSPEEGVMTLSVDHVEEHFSDQIPEEVTLNPDGTMDIQVPKGTEFNAETGMLTVPAGEISDVSEIPPAFNAQLADDGSVSLTLPSGVQFNEAEGTVHLDNYWTNQVTPESVEITPTGQVEVSLPPTTAYYPDGSFSIPEGQADFVDAPVVPEYIAEGPDWVEGNPDGSVTFEPPTGMQVNAEAGTFTMPVDAVQEHFEAQIPEEVTFNPNGTMDIQISNGTTYDAAAHTLSLPPGEAGDPAGIPAGFNPQMTEGGGIVVTLPPGAEFDPGTGTLHLDNHWTNEVVQHENPNIEISPEGQMQVALPPGTDFHADGSFTIPEQHADFIDNPPPAYVNSGPEWVAVGPDGSVSFQPPAGFQVDPQAGMMSMPVDAVHDHFEGQIPDDTTLNPDGTMDIKVPEDTQYNADTRMLTLSAGEMHDPSGVPPAFSPQLNADGSFSVTLPPGADFNPETGSVHFNNAWANEIVKADHPNMEITPEGQLHVELPQGTQYYQDGSFSVPPQHADFVDHPAPEYCSNGPEWTSYNSDGSVTMQPPAEIQIDPQAGTMTFSAEYANEQLDPIIPNDIHINRDGSVDMPLPQGVEYHADAGTLDFPAGEARPGDFPEDIEAQWNPDGSVTVTLPEGIDYNAANNSVHVSNTWVNQIAPEPIEISPDGQIQVSLPPGTQYFENGSLTIPSGQADFLNEGSPEQNYAQGQPQYQQAAG